MLKAGELVQGTGLRVKHWGWGALWGVSVAGGHRNLLVCPTSQLTPMPGICSEHISLPPLPISCPPKRVSREKIPLGVPVLITLNGLSCRLLPPFLRLALGAAFLGCGRAPGLRGVPESQAGFPAGLPKLSL